MSLIVLVRHTRRTHRWLVVAWLLSAGVFLAIDVLVGLQVRYGYFATPMVCAGLALLLDRLMDRRWGSIAGWGITGLITFTGLILWLNGVLWAVKPAMAALTH